MSADFRDDTDVSTSSSEPVKSKQSLSVKDTSCLSVMKYKVIFREAQGFIVLFLFISFFLRHAAAGALPDLTLQERPLDSLLPMLMHDMNELAFRIICSRILICYHPH